MQGLNKVIDYLQQHKVKSVYSGDQNLAFWDAQLKAILAQKLQGIIFWQVVHDVDYLSKIRDWSILKYDYDGDGYAVVPHNSTFSLDIWTAAFEIMSLFGGEVIVDPAELRNHQYPWKTIYERYPDFVDRESQAFGWRGIVNVTGNDIIAGEIIPKDLEDEVKEIVDFAVIETRKIVKDANKLNFEPLYRIQKLIVNDGELLNNLYIKTFKQSLIEIFGKVPENIRYGSSSELLRFNTDTCSRPIFEILDVFLNKETRDLAIDSYNRAVNNTHISSLDKFAEGAIPFDLYIPRIGRGTLRYVDKKIYISSGMGNKPINIAVFNFEDAPNVYDLAKAVESKFGKNTSLIGKAIVLPLMILREAPLVLNEKGSSYFPIVHKLYERLKNQGISINLHPVIRMVYNCLDNINILGSEVVFKLPEHLIFISNNISNKDKIDAPSLSIEWRKWVERAKNLYNYLLNERSPEKILQIIMRYDQRWLDLYDNYLVIKETFADEAKRQALSTEEKESLIKEKKEIEENIQREKLRIMCYCKKVEALELFNHRPPWWCLFLFGNSWFQKVKQNSSVYLEYF